GGGVARPGPPDSPVPIGAAAVGLDIGALVPEREQACAAVVVQKVGVSEVEAPVDHADHNALAGGAIFARAAEVAGSQPQIGMRRFADLRRAWLAPHRKGGL